MPWSEFTSVQFIPASPLCLSLYLHIFLLLLDTGHHRILLVHKRGVFWGASRGSSLIVCHFQLPLAIPDISKKSAQHFGRLDAGPHGVSVISAQVVLGLLHCSEAAPLDIALGKLTLLCVPNRWSTQQSPISCPTRRIHENNNIGFGEKLFLEFSPLALFCIHLLIHKGECFKANNKFGCSVRNWIIVVFARLIF